jgi:transposase-like protein
MRLRLAPVEYKICTTEYCENRYEGSYCPRCKQAFAPEKIRKDLQDLLILVDVDPPVYEPAQRYRCTDCKNLFDLSEPDVVSRARCNACGQPLLSRRQLETVWKDAETILQRARWLDRARRQMQTCPHCAQPVPSACWCPLHSLFSHAGTTGGLPQNPTVVWVRTFHSLESLEELQDREWMTGKVEIETEIE